MPFNSSNNRLKNKKNISYFSSLPSGSSNEETIIFQQKPWNKAESYNFDLNFRFDLSFKNDKLSPTFLYPQKTYKSQILTSEINIDEIPKEIIYDFSSGISNDWVKQENFNEITIDGNPSAGNFNGDTINAELVPSTIKELGGYRIKSIEIVWQESSSNNGFTFQFLDDSGNDLILLGGNNPQWEVEDADGITTPHNGSGYDRWVRYTAIFHWDGTYTYEFYDIGDGTLRTNTRNMFNNTNFYKFILNDRNGYWGYAYYMAITSVKITMY